MSKDGFILPVTFLSLFLVAMICLNELEELKQTQSELKTSEQADHQFFIFQSAKKDLCQLVQNTLLLKGSGDLLEGNGTITYTFSALTPNQYEIHMTQRTPSGSLVSAWFIYNRETKQLEKWVTV